MEYAIRIYIYVYTYMIRETHFSSVVLGLRNVRGVKCQPFLKHSSHWKWALKMIFKESGCFQFPEAVVSSTAKKKPTLYRTLFTTSSRCSIGVVCAE